MALTKVTGEGVGTLTSGISGTDITLSGGVNIFNSSTDSIDIRGTGNRCEIDNPDNNSILLKTGGTTRIRIDPNGLLFGSDTAAANALDDYEEGTWTPSFSGLSNTPTYHVLSGRYTKVGRFVMVQFSMQTNASPTFSDNNAELQITGLPFAIESVGYVSSVGAVASQAFSFNGSNNSQGTTGQVVSVATTSEHITFKVVSSGNSRGDVRNVGVTGGGIIETTLCYTAT